MIARYDASGHLDSSFDAWLKEPYYGAGDGTVFPNLYSDPSRYEGGLIRDVVVRDDGTVFAPTLFDDRRRIYGVTIDDYGYGENDWDRYVYDSTSDGAEIGGVVPLADGRMALAARTNGEGVVVIVREADAEYARYTEDLRWSTGDFVAVAMRTNSDGDLLLADDQRVVKYDLDGNVLANSDNVFPDQSFGIRDIAVQTNGKVIVTGTLFTETTHHIFTARFDVDGTIDDAYGVNGVAVSAYSEPSEANAIAVQSNGRIVVWGNIGNSLAAVAFDNFGSADGSFGNHGTTQIVATEDTLAHVGTALAIQDDGAVVATGFITRDDGREDVVLLKLQGDNSVVTPTVTHVTPDNGRQDRDAVTNASELTFHGTAQPALSISVTVTVNGIAAGVVTAASDGSWFLDYSHVNLPEGVHHVVAVASVSGQSSQPSEGLTVVIDQTAPDPSVPELRRDSH